jgi:hypothetical protein
MPRNNWKLTTAEKDDLAHYSRAQAAPTVELAAAYAVTRAYVGRLGRTRYLPPGYTPRFPIGQHPRDAPAPTTVPVDDASDDAKGGDDASEQEIEWPLFMQDPTTPPRPHCSLPFRHAIAHAGILEGRGWRAEACRADFDHGYVEVRDLTVRHHPKIATLRSERDVAEFYDTHPAHGIKGRVPTASDYGMSPERDRAKVLLEAVTLGTLD